MFGLISIQLNASAADPGSHWLSHHHHSVLVYTVPAFGLTTVGLLLCWPAVAFRQKDNRKCKMQRHVLPPEPRKPMTSSLGCRLVFTGYPLDYAYSTRFPSICPNFSYILLSIILFRPCFSIMLRSPDNFDLPPRHRSPFSLTCPKILKGIRSKNRFHLLAPRLKISTHSICAT